MSEQIPPNPPNNPQENTSQPKQKSKAVVLSVLLIILFIPISIYAVAFFFSFLTVGAFSGESKYDIAMIGILAIWVAVVYLAIRIFRHKIKKYLGPKSKISFIVPLIILALPFLFSTIAYFILTKPDRVANNCEDFLSKNFQITAIVNERLTPEEKAIKITAKTVVETPMSIAIEGGSLYEEPYEKEHLILDLNFDSSEKPNPTPDGLQEIMVKPGTQEINFSITPSTSLTKPNYYGNIALEKWTGKKSFGIKKFNFIARSSEGECSSGYPLKRINPYGSYITQGYTKQDLGL